MVLCLIVGCGSKSGRDKGLYFARVPSVVTNQGEEAQKLSEERRSRWISAMSRDDLTEEILENDRVCEKYFVSGRAAKSWDKFNIDWVPTLLLGHKKATDRADHKEAAAKRSERARERELVKKPAFEKRERELELERTAKRQKLNEPGEQVSNLSFEGNENEEKKLTVEAGTQTEEFEYLFSSLNIDRKPFDRWEFVQNEEKVKFYTGLPSFDILQNVFEHVSQFVAYKSQNLTTFQEFVMTLIKLKLDAPHQDLSYRFNVSLSTVSRIFSSWMVALDVRLAPLINWPEREDLWRTMPQCFKYSFGNKTTVIIDCFEVFINRLSNLLARAQTWSSYKHHNTVKVLIGITPQGTISYVSQAWGGRTSDKYLTENCGILNKLLPGDLVLADRGFTIAESVMFQQAQLAIPAFTKGKDQLDPVDVEKTRGIANVRIHVEKVIGLLRRKYSILSGILPIDFLISNPGGSQEEATPVIDRIINVSAALVNLCPGIVPLD
ncbi:unnamed protein product [Pocillopora meandrina]|uniref:THAP-type domain-containing protein n=1 Tax=Pocillopora meandrina TaxID=46732 RepID=A0AAU9WLJ6_9CNID|nr:unnamed protein product [Pocillopora meandrina]